LADAAAASGLFRLLYELDWSDATVRLGRLVGVEPRPDAQSVLLGWLTRLETTESGLAAQLIDAVPTSAKAWAADDAPRLIAAARAPHPARAAISAGLCAPAGSLLPEGAPLPVPPNPPFPQPHGLAPPPTLGRLGARLAAATAGLPPPANAADIRNAWEAVG